MGSHLQINETRTNLMEKTKRKKNVDLPPPDGIPMDVWENYSRQKRWQISRQAAGVCTACGVAPIGVTSKRLCNDCSSKQRERMRSRTNAARRNINSASYAE